MTTTSDSTTIDANKLFSEAEHELILKLSGWEEYEDERLRALYGDPRADAPEESDTGNDKDQLLSEVEADSALLAFLNEEEETGDPLAEGNDKDEADADPSTETLLREFLGPRYDFLSTVESRKRLLSELVRQVQGAVLFKKGPLTAEMLYAKLLYYFGHLQSDTLDAIRIAMGSRAGGSGASNYGTEAEKKRMLNEYLLSIPFGIVSKTNTIAVVRKALDDALYGLQEAKKKIVQHLTLSAHGSGQSEALLLVGPPGTGKTALASAVASALGLPFSKLSFAGLSDILTLKGTNSSWGSSQASFLVKELCRVKCENPVMLLDEVDKSGGYGSSGAVINVLAELLDPRQSNSFRDLFLEFPVDFSKTMFILTANDPDSIPSYILDRCQVIEVSPYSLDERATIIQRYIPKQITADYCFNFEIEITELASKGFAQFESLREARRAVMSHVSAMLEAYEPGHVPTIVIKRYRAELVPPPSKGLKNTKSKRIAGFASQRGDDNPQGGSQGPGPGM